MTCGYWIGQPGHLMQVDGGHVQLVRSWGDSVNVYDGGAAPAYAHVNPRRGPRAWAVGLGATQPKEIAALHELSLLGVSVMMVDPWAQVTNVLTPEASLVTASGRPRVGGFDLAGGGHVASVAYNPHFASPDRALADTSAGAGPVLPGQTVTASAWFAGTGQVQILFADANNDVAGYGYGLVVAGMDMMRRSVVTMTAPSNAIAAYVVGVGAQYMARAALTWTDTATEWGIGGVALQAVVHRVEDDIAMAVPGASESLRRSDVAFTVTEIGV